MELSTDLQLLCNSAEFKELANFYANKSILDIVGISRLEKVHSNFLYWLFNINESHQLGTIPFRNFLFSCVGQKYRMIGNYELVKNMEYIFPNDWTDILLPYKEQYDITDYKIEKEYYIQDVGRIDLLISCKLRVKEEYQSAVNKKELDMLFIIENKIDSFEHDDQTEHYYNYFNNSEEFKNKQKVYIYLVPDVEINKPINENFLPFQYQDAINMTISKCLDKPMAEETRAILNSYLRCLTFPSDKDNSIVAITDKEIDLVNKLWKKYSKGLKFVLTNRDTNAKIIYTMYKELFDNVFYISVKYQTYFDNLGKEDLEEMEKLTKKTTAMYEYKGETYKRNGGKYSLGRLALAIVKEYVNKQNSNVDTILKDFGAVCATYHKIPLIIEEKDIKKPEYIDEETGKSLYFIEKDEIFEINKKKYVLYAYWDNSEIQKLVEQTKASVKML